MRVVLIAGSSLVIGVVLTLLPLEFGSTSVVTHVLHWPMLLLDRWMVRHGDVIGNSTRIPLFLAVNTLIWAVICFIIGCAWVSQLKIDPRHSNGNS